ncbi:hypothetical protein [Sphingomonas sp.]|uniref:hypothetical protein n=1 Tax=Sphingomonas sp. TaxID=28214 RepID=UPI00258A0B3D|nr:hypothetical protein [Sphingomonas sp.]
MLVALIVVSEIGSAAAESKITQDQVEQARSKKDRAVHQNDITVTAKLDPEPKQAVPIKQRYEMVVSSRQASAESYRFVRCAKRVDPQLVRQLIEELPHRYDSEYALDRVIREEQACYTRLASPIPPPTYYGTCNPIGDTCRSFFDRGAWIEWAIRKTTPSLTLHDGDLSNPTVIDRFNARTATLNKTRYPQERIGYAVVACMVANHTSDAMAMIRSEPGSQTEGRLGAILLGQSPPCTGKAKKIYTDVRQFRVYVAETIYFFATSFRGTTSLITSDAKRGEPFDDANH